MVRVTKIRDGVPQPPVRVAVSYTVDDWAPRRERDRYVTMAYAEVRRRIEHYLVNHDLIFGAEISPLSIDTKHVPWSTPMHEPKVEELHGEANPSL